MAAPFKCPHVGGDFTFGQEANVNSLDENTSGTISTHDVALNIFEQLITRDEKNRVVPDIADSIQQSPDGMTYTFPLRTGVKFHNGKTMTSADVLASFDRFRRVALGRGSLDNVAGYEAPDAKTFVVHMKKPQPTFLETLSAFSFPVIESVPPLSVMLVAEGASPGMTPTPSTLPFLLIGSFAPPSGVTN